MHRCSDLYEHFQKCTYKCLYHYQVNDIQSVYVHLSDIVEATWANQSTASHRYTSLPVEFKRTLTECEWHRKGNCHLVQIDVGFVLYLLWIAKFVDSNETKEEVKEVEGACIEPDAEAEEEVEDFHEEEERKMITDFDAAKFRHDSITKIETEEEKEEIQDTVATLPTYVICNKKYVLLNDIQHLFDMREDHCLGALAQWSEADEGFIDFTTPCQVERLDTEGEDFISKDMVGYHMAYMDQEYQKTLPTEEEFEEIQRRKNIQNMGREKTKKPIESKKPTGSIDLFRDNLLIEDETPMVSICLNLLSYHFTLKFVNITQTCRTVTNLYVYNVD